MPPSIIPSLRKSNQNTGTRKNARVSWSTSMKPKKIFTPVKGENSWQTQSEMDSALRSPEDQVPKYVKTPRKIEDVNTKWRLEYDAKQSDDTGNKLYQLYKNNKKTMLLTAAAMGGLVAAVSALKTRKRGGNRGGNRGGKRHNKTMKK